MKLEIELVPKSAWNSNVRSMVSGKEWDTLRFKVYEHANHNCEICGSKGKRHPVECHEVWSYDQNTSIQKLTRLIALCPTCHQVKHWGLSEILGYTKSCIVHFKIVNSVNDHALECHLSDVWKQWEDRNLIKWTQDISLLESYK
jgi:hypothetical protein